MEDTPAGAAFAQLLQELRARSGLSYAELGRRSFTSASSTHRYCTAKSLPTDADVVARLARACGADPQETAELVQGWKAAAAACAETTADAAAAGASDGSPAGTSDGSAAGAAPGRSVAEGGPDRAPAGAAPAAAVETVAGQRPAPAPEAPFRSEDPQAGARGRLGPAGRRRIVIPVAVGLGVLTIGGVLFDRAGRPAGGAEAVSNAGADVCVTREGERRADGPGGTYNRVWTREELCPNVAGAPLYETPLDPDEPGAARVGTMHSTRSWFVCWTQGRRHDGGNRIWYYTQGDVSDPAHKKRRAWGFMPARYLATETDPDPGLAPCPPARPGGHTAPAGGPASRDPA